MRADAHIHLFEDGYPCRPISSTRSQEFESYRALRLHYGIARALVVGYEGEERFLGNNDYILGLARTHPWIEPLAYLRTDKAPDLGVFERFVEAGHPGAALFLSRQAEVAWSSEDLSQIVSMAAIISINAGPDGIEKARRVIGQLGGADLLISHLGLPGAHAATATATELRAMLRPATQLAAETNVFIKLSGLYAIDPIFPHEGAKATVEILLAAFGPSRLLWGSDFSPAVQHLTVNEMMALPDWLSGLTTQRQLDAIAGGNLIDVLRRIDRGVTRT